MVSLRAPTAPANVQIVDKARRGQKVNFLKRRKNMIGRWNNGTPRLNCTYVRERSHEIRARSPQSYLTFLAMND